MNLSALTASEVLRVCSPETDLEKRLFDICNELEGEAQQAKEDADQVRRELDNYDSDLHDDIKDIRTSVQRAIDYINSGKVNDGVNILKEI